MGGANSKMSKQRNESQGMVQAQSISFNTYYKRLNVINKERANNADTAAPKIVPLSISADIEKSEPIREFQTNEAHEKLIIRKDGMMIELPSNISERMLLTLLRGLKQC